MAKREWEDWLSRPAANPADEAAQADAARRARFYSLYLDMIESCRAEVGRVANLHALAAYVVWLHTPKRLRVPATQIELARLLDYQDDDVFRKWRKRYPHLFADDRTRDVVRRLVLDHVADVVDASLRCAIDGGYQGFQDRRLMLEIAGVHKPTLDTSVAVSMNAEQLAAILPQAREQAAKLDAEAAAAWNPDAQPEGEPDAD